MKYIWNEEKNAFLLKTRGVCFEHVVQALNAGHVLYNGKNDTSMYDKQLMFLVVIQGYVYKVPYRMQDNSIQFITLYPSRKYKSLLFSYYNG